MNTLGLVLLIGAAFLGYEAYKHWQAVGAAAAGGSSGSGTVNPPASVSGNGGADSGAQGSYPGTNAYFTGAQNYWGQPANNGRGYTSADVANTAARIGFNASDIQFLVMVANRESGIGSNMGPACARCVGCPIINGWQQCYDAGLTPAFGIFQWQSIHSIWQTPNCLGDLNCELQYMWSNFTQNGRLDRSPWQV